MIAKLCQLRRKILHEIRGGLELRLQRPQLVLLLVFVLIGGERDGAHSREPIEILVL